MYKTILAVILPFFLSGQELLTKQNALALAIEKNFALKVAQSQVELAKANTSRELFGFNPIVNINGGGVYNLDNINARFQDGRVNSVRWASSNNVNASANFNYLLFDGYNRKFNLERSQRLFSAEQINAKIAMDNLVFQVLNAYYEIARLEADYDNLQASLLISKDRLERVKVGFDYARNTLLDVYNAEVDVNTDSIALMNQKQLVENSKHNLNFFIDNNLLADFLVDTTIQMDEFMSRERILQEIEASNPTILFAKNNIDIRRIEEDISLTTKLPSISFNADYGALRSQNNPANFLAGITNNGLSTNLTLTWNLYDGGRRNVQNQLAKIGTKNSELNLELTKKQIFRDFENAWSIYQNRLKIRDALAKNIETSRANFERSEERYQLGRINSIDFRLAQQNLLSAQTAFVRARFDAKLAELQVMQIGGKIQEAVF